MEPYARILKLIRELQITGEDLVKGRIKLIYEKFIHSQMKYGRSNSFRLHMKIFPNYLKTFNYKLSVDILPCKTKYVDFGLDTDSRCNFCSVHADTSLYLFSQCSVLRFVWELLDQVMITLGFRFRFLNAKRSNFIDLRNIYISKNEKKVVMYLNSVCNFKIWSINQKVQHEELTFERKHLLSAMFRAICGRKAVEQSNRVLQCKKVGNLNRLLQAMKSIFFPPSGIG